MQATTQRSQLAARKNAQFAPFKLHFAAGRLDQLQDGLANRRLAATGFANQRQRAAAQQFERHAIDRFDMPHRALQDAAPDREMHAQVLDDEQCGIGRRNNGGCDVALQHTSDRPPRLDQQMAAHAMIFSRVIPRGFFITAARPGVRATFGKAAAARHGRQRGNLSGDGFQLSATPRRVGQGGKQLLRVRMAR